MHSQPLQHTPRLIQSHHVHHLVHGSGAVGRFNARLAVTITRAVGTMWACYLFVLVALVSLPAAFAAFLGGDTVTGVAWLSQAFLQLVLLPLLLVGQRVISTAQDARAEADHETLTAIHQINITQSAILELLAARK